ncbi:NADPH-dependent aldo-keto reductase, chloroplastic-like isoform X2 [Camellia sinensis]|uniref:NADPH-dependent aldo-keto reductase, chloroplastic-like isoform X2 n=1 Tax=Camellia sinensis TaxID=4442 RepID=UPI00103613C3|nr:NADPH-dependent aldo-keto reductase, chloroplastic-like isoform X2 [Camellia sinensis]
MKYNQVRLNCGATIPTMGFGTYSSQNDREETKQAVHTALKMGYRHFDTAKIYGSEAAVGEALREAIFEDQMIEREDIFLTSKLWGSDHHDSVSALKQTLQRLGMEYVDMYLVHWPVKLKPWANNAVPKEDEFERLLDLETTWAGMERCLDMGMCRCIGVSNFSTNKIQSLLDFASVAPALNQVALRWGLSKGASVIVKSFNEERMKENMGALDLRLDDHDLLNIEKMEERKIMRGEFLVNQTTSPYKTIQDLWDGEI